MRGQFGKRPKAKEVMKGVRELSSTYGKTKNISFDAKVDENAPFLVESEAERLVSQAIGIDPEFTASVPQGVAVDLVTGTLLHTRDERDKAKKRHADVSGDAIYTADFSVNLASRACAAIEVKLDRFPGSEAYLQKLANAKEIFIQHGYELWLVVIPTNQTRPVWSNIPLLAQAKLRTDLKPSAAVIQKAEAFLANGSHRAKDLLLALGMGPNILPILIAFGLITADLLEGHLKGDTQVKAAFGDLTHLNLIRRLCQTS